MLINVGEIICEVLKLILIWKFFGNLFVIVFICLVIWFIRFCVSGMINLDFLVSGINVVGDIYLLWGCF